ncbi:hypothetical protein JTE90_023730 [Oedothorax gibbosus]|uniref:J domain-containing protein n=1 Tax=Oedothorax gibbosus TaxID=931172 RepID=A0AAV6VBR1_9ARAC|nr:hypothetical protein JTE90_023730 [Oedothorax gibbosus]
MLNLYQILDINPTASQSEVVSASEKLIAEWDPSKIEDRKNRAVVAGVLREILEARDVLSDHRKRKEYDVSIGLAKIVYKEKFKSKQRIQNSQSGIVDDKIRGHNSITHSQETDSEAEEFYDSSSGLNSDKERGVLDVNRQQEAIKSDQTGEVSEKSNSGNTAEYTFETPIKSFENNDASISERDATVLGNQQQSVEKNQTFTEPYSLFEKNNNIQNKPQKNNEAFPSNEHTQPDPAQNVQSVSNNDSSVSNTVSKVIVAAKSVLNNINKGMSSKLSDLNTSTDSSTSIATNYPNKKENKSFEDTLKQKSEATTADRKAVQDNISESALNSNDYVSPSSKAESNNTLNNKSSKSINPTKTTKSGNNSEEKNLHENQNISISKSEEDSSVVEIPDVNDVESFNHNLIDNNITKPDDNQITSASDPSNVDKTTNQQELSPSNKNSSNVGDKIINKNQKPIDTSGEKLSNVKSSESLSSRADAVLKADNEKIYSVNINEDSKQTDLPNTKPNSDENSKPTENQVGLLNKSSDNNNDSIVFNSSMDQTSSENVKENISNSDNGVETENESISSENPSNGVLSKVFSRILQNSEEKDAQSKAQNSLISSDTRKKHLEDVTDDLNRKLVRTSDSKSADSINQTKDSQTKLKLHTPNTVVNNKQQTSVASTSENSNLIKGKESKSNLFDTRQRSSSEIFSSETVWKRDEQSNLANVNSTPKKPNPSQDRIRTKSVSASTISRGSETKTMYFYGPESERVEVYVDGKLRVQIDKGESEDSYTSDWHNSATPTTTKSIRALTTIEANGAKIKTMRICDGKQETISVHKDHVLMCRISTINYCILEKMNCYKTLRIRPTASFEEIKIAADRMLSIWRLDDYDDFKQVAMCVVDDIETAKRILLDQSARKKHDAELKERTSQYTDTERNSEAEIHSFSGRIGKYSRPWVGSFYGTESDIVNKNTTDGKYESLVDIDNISKESSESVPTSSTEDDAGKITSKPVNTIKSTSYEEIETSSPDTEQMNNDNGIYEKDVNGKGLFNKETVRTNSESLELIEGSLNSDMSFCDITSSTGNSKLVKGDHVFNFSGKDDQTSLAESLSTPNDLREQIMSSITVFRGHDSGERENVELENKHVESNIEQNSIQCINNFINDSKVSSSKSNTLLQVDEECETLKSAKNMQNSENEINKLVNSSGMSQRNSLNHTRSNNLSVKPLTKEETHLGSTKEPSNYSTDFLMQFKTVKNISNFDAGKYKRCSYTVTKFLQSSKASDVGNLNDALRNEVNDSTICARVSQKAAELKDFDEKAFSENAIKEVASMGSMQIRNSVSEGNIDNETEEQNSQTTFTNLTKEIFNSKNSTKSDFEKVSYDKSITVAKQIYTNKQKSNATELSSMGKCIEDHTDETEARAKKSCNLNKSTNEANIYVNEDTECKYEYKTVGSDICFTSKSNEDTNEISVSSDDIRNNLYKVGHSLSLSSLQLRKCIYDSIATNSTSLLDGSGVDNAIKGNSESALESDEQQITSIDHIKDVTVSDHSKVDKTTKHQELLPPNQNSSNVDDKIVNKNQKPINTFGEKLLNVKSTESLRSRDDAVLKLDKHTYETEARAKKSYNLNKSTNEANIYVNQDTEYKYEYKTPGSSICFTSKSNEDTNEISVSSADIGNNLFEVGHSLSLSSSQLRKCISDSIASNSTSLLDGSDVENDIKGNSESALEDTVRRNSLDINNPDKNLLGRNQVALEQDIKAIGPQQHLKYSQNANLIPLNKNSRVSEKAEEETSYSSLTLPSFEKFIRNFFNGTQESENANLIESSNSLDNSSFVNNTKISENSKVNKTISGYSSTGKPLDEDSIQASPLKTVRIIVDVTIGSNKTSSNSNAENEPNADFDTGNISGFLDETYSEDHPISFSIRKSRTVSMNDECYMTCLSILKTEQSKFDLDDGDIFNWNGKSNASYSLDGDWKVVCTSAILENFSLVTMYFFGKNNQEMIEIYAEETKICKIVDEHVKEQNYVVSSRNAINLKILFLMTSIIRLKGLYIVTTRVIGKNCDATKVYKNNMLLCNVEKEFLDE